MQLAIQSSFEHLVADVEPFDLLLYARLDRTDAAMTDMGRHLIVGEDVVCQFDRISCARNLMGCKV